MSEKINVTVISGNGNDGNYDGESHNGNHSRDNYNVESVNISHNINMTLMSTLLKENLIAGNFCCGRGSCKRCRIQFLSGATVPSQSDRSAFTPDELREGWRLACLSRPKADCVIRLAQAELYEQSKWTDIVTKFLKIDSIYKDEGIYEDAYASGSNGCLIAVDLGTTTIAMQLMEICSGRVIDTYCAMNPQRSYGADVLSRIQADNVGHGQELRDSVWEVLRTGIRQFCKTDIRGMCIAGNTTMEHLLMGLSTKSLGESPFIPVEKGLQKCALSLKKDICADVAEDIFHDIPGENRTSESDKVEVYITPTISAFVGGDIVAGLYHCGMLDMLQPKIEKLEQEQAQAGSIAALFIDLGTNGEIAVTDGERLIVTATAAGPAFEGGANASAPGSDMIEIIASLLRQGIIDENGLLKEEYFEQGIDVPIQNAQDKEQAVIHLTQKDIRDIQMAKAAVRAGIEILYEKIGKPKLDNVYLAGGFGYYLNVNAAIEIGLLPEYMRDIVTAVGNTSLAGAFEIGRELCLGRLNEEMFVDKLQMIESINLANQENFEAVYLSNLNFPVMQSDKK
ncbi:MAG: ASKHA domain-containing protein [Butyrivibrio sp.]|nr:ASKHA domain-containing protein [Butyrivibrio sp.]